MAHVHSLSSHGVTLLGEILPDDDVAAKAISAFERGNTDIEQVVKSLRDDYEGDNKLHQVQLVLEVFWATSEILPATRTVLSEAKATSIRDVALDCVSLCRQLPVSAQRAFFPRVYDIDTTGCIINAIETNAFKGAENAAEALQLLKSKPDFDIERDSVWTLRTSSEDDGPLEFLKILQRLQAVAVSVIELIALWTAGYRSALQISNTEDSILLSDMSENGIEDGVALAIRGAATAIKARNEHLLMLQAHSTVASQINIPVLDVATQGVSLHSPAMAAMAAQAVPDLDISPDDLGGTEVQAAFASLSTSEVVGLPNLKGSGESPSSSKPAAPINLDTLFGDSLSAAELASKATWGSDAVYEYLHGPSPNLYLPFTADGSLDFCHDSTLAFGPGAMEMMAPYSQYNTEIGVHMPMAMMERFASSQQFDAALAAARLIFNPLEEGLDTNRCWKWPPFRVLKVTSEVQQVLDDPEVTEHAAVRTWRENPFSPYAIAQSRPLTYMKWVVTRYIEVLVAYGDSYFRQNTLESIPYALNLYVQSSKLFGPAPQTIRDPGQVWRTETYRLLSEQLNGFSNALVDMEVQFPFVVRTVSSPTVAGVAETIATSMAINVLQAASTQFFGLPANPKVAALRDLIHDRLYKIRNYLDINGHVQVLPLFDPPLDPGALVGAVAGGARISQLSSDPGTTMANFRFPYLLGKALELCGELKQLSAAFLAAKQNGDGETMAVMRTRQEAVVHESGLQMRKLQLEEATLSLESLRESRRGPVMRLQHYLKLSGEPDSRVPEPGADFSEIDAQIQAPTKDGLRMSPLEKLEMTRREHASYLNLAASSYSTLASILALIPDLEENIMPVGAGVTLKAGPALAAKGAETMSSVARLMGEEASMSAASAGAAAGMIRQLQDRRLQVNVAGREIKAIDKQISGQQKRIEMANLEIETQMKQMEHTAKTLEFLRGKYTNAELFAWMEGAVRSSFYDMYTLAYDTAKKAEMAYAFERGATGLTPFIRPGYWDAGHDGLLCGDALYLGLKKMEAAYMETRGHDYEITRHISLRALTPLALLTLRRTGTVDFSLPEALFDMDFSGHYRRRIKTVAVSIPCVAGPYTSISCTLRLLSHRYRYTAAQASGAKDYAEIEGGDPRFRTNLVPITAIAVSTAQNDAGVFDLNFRDERYMPFEGAGAVSRWRLELPKEMRLFDYESIGDVVMHMRYTSSDGGERLKAAATGSLLGSLGKLGAGGDGASAPLTAVLDLKNDFPSEWHRFSVAEEAGPRTMTLSGLQGHLPFYAKSVASKRPIATQVTVVSGTGANAEELQLALDGRAFNERAKDIELMAYRLGGASLTLAFDKEWKLTATATKDKAVERLWLLVHYRLK